MHKFILMLGMENISFTLLQHYLPGQFYKVPKGQGGTRFLYSFNFFMHFGATGLLSLYGFYCWRYFFVHDNNNNNSSRSLKSCVSALVLHLSVFFSPQSLTTHFHYFVKNVLISITITALNIRFYFFLFL